MAQFWLQITRRTFNTSQCSKKQKRTQAANQLRKGKHHGDEQGPMECNIEVEEHSVKSMKGVVYLGVKFSADGMMALRNRMSACCMEPQTCCVSIIIVWIHYS